MRITFNFNMEDEDDRELHKSMLKARAIECFIFDWENSMRSKCKYGTEEESAFWEQVREAYFEIKKQSLDD